MNAPINAIDSLLDAPEAPSRTAPVVDLKAKERASKRAKSGTTGSHTAHAVANAQGIIKNWRDVYQMTATDCACCGQSLRDAVSVTRGIGPVCSKQHYDLDIEITDEMVMKAKGLLFASSLSDTLKDAVRKLADQPREMLNVLVWWTAAHLDDLDAVLSCAEIATALGFESLGNRLRERNTNVIITTDTDHEGHFILRCRSRKVVRDNMARVVAKGDAESLPREGRFKYGWRVKDSRKDLVWTILGEVFGGEWATVPAGETASKVLRIPEQNWRQVRSAFRRAYPRPTMQQAAPPANIVRIVDGTIEVHTPSRNWGFIDTLKSTVPWKQRRWNRNKMCWTVEIQHESLVRRLVAQHFNGAQ